MLDHCYTLESNYVKSPTQFWMANLNPGHYNFEIYFKSPHGFSVPANYNWQSAVLQVKWFEDVRVVSDGIKCYPTSTATNNYNNWGPIMTFKLFYNCQTIEPYYQLISYLLKCLHPLIWLPLLMSHHQKSSYI